MNWRLQLRLVTVENYELKIIAVTCYCRKLGIEDYSCDLLLWKIMNWRLQL
jgi:hypothetical protein